eukprot:CAMPEP_0183375042 /NCGR_PEP_ID=MMETSP0164_2-20130417/116225_1 /TAXON_ID=221442 /ORGANISM="Coccolithus pelagicus ssp braarudi, Strain PLY182g" /LENGTH=35 /DNA_ID= /DNA_START= /DNA_END= /DNA_ORIENTATION=
MSFSDVVAMAEKNLTASAAFGVIYFFSNVGNAPPA